MGLTNISYGESLGARRGDIVVCIPVYGGHELFVACLRSVLAHTPADVPILICDDASPDERSEQFVRTLAEADPRPTLFYLRQSANLGFPGNVNAGFLASAPADVVILNSDCEVGAGWLDRLSAAANSDSTVASATALTNHGTIVSAPDVKPSHLPQEWTIDRAAAAVAQQSLALYPRLPTAIGHCLYIRRAALDLVGDFDLNFSPGYGEEVDFSQRCLRAGLCHVVADDVYVLHHGGSSFERTGRKSEIQLAHEKIINARYPYYAEAVQAVEQENGQLARSVGVVRRALRGTRVLVDARVLAGATTGTQIHAVELLAALSRSDAVAVTALIPDQLSAYGRESLAQMDNVERLSRHQAEDERRRFDVVHRPFQINNFDDLALLRRLGDRLIVTNQDLIGFYNPLYFEDFERWEGYRQITRAALSASDGVLFFSEHARRQALAENLVEAHRTYVVHIGVDHVLAATATSPRAPSGLETLAPETPVMMCIGTDFHHKNRLFALRVLAEMQRRHDWTGRLVFAGPKVSQGSSHGQESEMLAVDPRLSGAVHELGALSEAEKAWLYDRSSLVIYPTVYEGFGLVPFEAADHARPCLWAPGTSLSEVLDDAAAQIVAWDAAATADNAIALLADPQAVEANLAAIRAAAAKLRWETTARGLIDAYAAVAAAPTVPGTSESRDGLSAGILNLNTDALNLVGPGGALPLDIQRPLLALASHRAVAGPVFAAVRAGYQLGYRFNQARKATRPT